MTHQNYVSALIHNCNVMCFLLSLFITTLTLIILLTYVLLLSCSLECENGTFGADCEQTCHCQDNALCRGDTGICDLAGGCAEHWTGENCQGLYQSLPPPPPNYLYITEWSLSLFENSVAKKW